MLMIFWRYLGNKVNQLTQWQGQNTNLTEWNPIFRVRKEIEIDSWVLTLSRVAMPWLTNKISFFLFIVSPGSTSRIFTTRVNFLYLEFKSIDFQPSREQVDRDMPVCIKTKNPSMRLMLDVTKICIETLSSLEMQSMTWSSYKNSNRLYELVDITPTGCISFVSNLYCGNISEHTLEYPPIPIKLWAAQCKWNSQDKVYYFLVDSYREGYSCFCILASAIPISMCSTIDQVFYVCYMITKFYPPLVT